MAHSILQAPGYHIVSFERSANDLKDAERAVPRLPLCHSK